LHAWDDSDAVDAAEIKMMAINALFEEKKEQTCCRCAESNLSTLIP
jgi:hypothetical protein